MDNISRALELASRLDHLGNCAEWIARATVHSDNSLCQTGTLMCVLVEDIREKINEILEEIETLSFPEGTH